MKLFENLMNPYLITIENKQNISHIENEKMYHYEKIYYLKKKS